MVYYFNKQMRWSISNLSVNKPSVEKVKHLLQIGQKVILLPIYKTFADFFIHLYVHNHFGLEVPFIFGNEEDTPGVETFRKIMKQVGYIYSRRSNKQSLQSKFINSSLLKEIVADSKLTMVFQNSERLRTGKFYRRTTSDLSIEWIIDAFRGLPKEAERIVLVPVMVSYDRVFEVRNLTKSMVTLKEGSFASSLASSVKRMQQFNKDQLGCVFVKYLEPIYLKEYMQTIEQTEPKADPAFKLTQELYLRQQEATPVTLNSLIAAVLLYEPDEKLAMSDLLARTNTIYQYVKIKQHTITMMQVRPQQLLCEHNIEHLGFKLKDKGKKTC